MEYEKNRHMLLVLLVLAGSGVRASVYSKALAVRCEERTGYCMFCSASFLF